MGEATITLSTACATRAHTVESVTIAAATVGATVESEFSWRHCTNSESEAVNRLVTSSTFSATNVVSPHTAGIACCISDDDDAIEAATSASGSSKANAIRCIGSLHGWFQVL